MLHLDPEKGIVKIKNGKVGNKGKAAKNASEKVGGESMITIRRKNEYSVEKNKFSVLATISAMTGKIPLEVKEEMRETALAIGKSAFSELTGVTAEGRLIYLPGRVVCLSFAIKEMTIRDRHNYFQ